MKKILITGGMGFIGSHLYEHLLETSDVQVRLFDNKSRDALRFLEVNEARTELMEGDIRDPKALAAACEGVDTVVHCAAIAGVQTVENKPFQTMEINLIGSYLLFKACIDAGVKRVVNFSTSEVYGPFTYNGSEDDMTTSGPVGKMRWSYAVAKIAAEHLGTCFGQEHGIKFTSVRPFNVYGPRQIGEGAIQQFILRALKDEDITINNDGTQVRAWCYVSDFVKPVAKLALGENFSGEVFNIGNPKASTTTLSLAHTVKRIAASNSEIVFKESQAPDVQVRVPSIQKAKDELGYDPEVLLEDGIARTIDFYRKENLV